MRKEVLKTGMNAAEAYEAPACEVMELRTEGVLCYSGELPDIGDGGGHEDGGTTSGRYISEPDEYWGH